MDYFFQSLCSGSSGNSLLLKTGNTTLLIDLGFSSMRGCRRALQGILPRLSGVLVTHLHTDHVHYAALRVMEEYRIPLYVHQGEARLLPDRHFRRFPFFALQIRPFGESEFGIGDLEIRPFRVPHDGLGQTFGFEIGRRRQGRYQKVVVATDFRDWRNLAPRFADAEFIYVEANHDPELLRAFPNRRSRFHLSNGECGRLLRQALDQSRTAPAGVMLGHLSAIRNRPSLALGTVEESLSAGGFRGVQLLVAPRHEPSPPFPIFEG